MNVYALNTLAAGEDTLEQVFEEIPCKGVIGLSNREANDKISGFSYQGDFCAEVDVPFIEVESYNLAHENDKAKLLALDIDVLLVTGWQRLVPAWLINHCKMCVIGIHGSPLGITKGRGRSPQNWALIMGRKSFSISIFQIDKNIDSGRIFATQDFVYSPFDDIKTSYYKASMLTAQMIVDLLRTPGFMEHEFELQNDDDAEYLPQRLPEDGQIDWHRSNEEVHDFIRGLTRPYPGAWTKAGEEVVKVWNAIPFEVPISKEKYQVGEVVKLFRSGDFVVRTHDGFMLVDDSDSAQTLQKGAVLESSDFEAQMDRIISRHQQKYPQLPVSSMVKGEQLVFT